MSVTVQCPQCRNSFVIGDELLGRTGRCTSCRTKFLPRPAEARAGDREAYRPAAPNRDSGVPKTVGRFQILARLGSGAFGTVYRDRTPAEVQVLALRDEAQKAAGLFLKARGRVTGLAFTPDGKQLAAAAGARGWEALSLHCTPAAQPSATQCNETAPPTSPLPRPHSRGAPPLQGPLTPTVAAVTVVKPETTGQMGRYGKKCYPFSPGGLILRKRS